MPADDALSAKVAAWRAGRDVGARKAAEQRASYAEAVLDMPEGAGRRAEIRQMLVDLLDVVEQSPDEAPLIAALRAYDADEAVMAKLRQKEQANG